MWVIRKVGDIFEIGYYFTLLNYSTVDNIHFTDYDFYCFDKCEDKLEAIELCSKLNGGH